MKMKKYFFVSVCTLVFVFLGFVPLFAQYEAEDEINYSYGVVVSSSPNQIVLLEYDYDRDEEVQVTYEINVDTKVENVESLDNLQKDDNVEIYYKEAEGKKIAVSVEKELFVDEDTTLNIPEEMTEDIEPEEMNLEGETEPAAEEAPATGGPQ